MRRYLGIGNIIVCLGLFVFRAERAESKIVFTGYGDLRFSPHGILEISADPALKSDPLLGPALLRPRMESRAFSIASLGIFATTSISEKSQFLVDFTYRDIGASVRTIRIQYAYLEYAHSDTLKLSLGKIMLPFGHLNDHRYYPFQRDSITPPTFASSILGLPISDTGASAQKRLSLGAVDLTTDVYAVNGYGPIPNTTNSFRSLGLPGGIQIANNIRSSNSNHEFSYGGRAKLSRTESPKLDFGISHHRGKWDPENLHLFEMTVTHLNLEVYRFRLNTEYLLMKARGDQGLAVSLGHPHWMTDGFFATLGYEAWQVWRGPLIPWVRYEEYFTRGDGGGGSSREALVQQAAGLKVAASENISIKVEVNRLRYELPWMPGRNLLIDLWTSLAGLSVTF